MVQRSLDLPPVIVRISRRKASVGVLVAILLASLFLEKWLHDGRPILITVLGTVISGIALIFFVWQLIDPAQIGMDADGLTYKHTFRTLHWPWQEIGTIRMSDGLVLCNRFGFPGFFWEVGSRELVELLNTARARWHAELSN